MIHSTVETLLYQNRNIGKNGLIAFVNAGDPNIHITKEILYVLKESGVDVVELCVPFENSFTDGEVIKRSHIRAIESKTSLLQVLELVRWSNENIGIPIVLLADYSYTVRPITIEYFLNYCKDYGVCANLLHGIPPKIKQSYLDISHKIGIETILSIYLESDKEIRKMTYCNAQGFIYIVSKYGRSGSKVEFDKNMSSKLVRLRNETTLPLAVGFGIKTKEHMDIVYRAGIDACVVGSSIVSLIEENIYQPANVAKAIQKYMTSIIL
jgi:tryptophan synthase alpha chain